MLFNDGESPGDRLWASKKPTIVFGNLGELYNQIEIDAAHEKSLK